MFPETMPSAPDIERAVISSLLFKSEHIPSVMHDGGVPFANVIGTLRDGLEESLEISGKKEFNIAAQIRDWVKSQDGHFTVTDCYRDLDLVTQRDRATCRMALSRLVEEGIITRHGDRRGSYRRIEADCRPVNWLDAPQTPLDLRFPSASRTSRWSCPATSWSSPGSPTRARPPSS